MVPLVPTFLPIVTLAPMVPLAAEKRSGFSCYQWYHWLPMVPLVKFPMVPLGEFRTHAILEVGFWFGYSEMRNQVYFLVGPSRVPLQSVVTISDMHHLNLSDHTHLEICISGIGAKDQLTGAKDSVLAINPQSRIRREKCDLELYSHVVAEKLSTVSPLVECSLDAELLVRTISFTLRKASEMSCSEPKKRKTKKGFPVWNDRIAMAVHNSKVAHFEWKKAGKPSDTNCCSHRRRLEARLALRREVRFTLFRQRQDLLGSVMSASEQDTKLFHRLVRKQRARPSAATETLKYD